MTGARTIEVPLAPRLTLATMLVAGSIMGVMIGLAITASAPIPGLPAPTAMVRVGIPVVRALLDLAAVTTVGLAILPLLIGFERSNHTEPVLAVTRRLAVASALVWAVTALVALLLQAAELRDGAVTWHAITDYVRDVGAGKALVFVAGFALLCAGLTAWSLRAGESVPTELRAATALFTLLPLPVTGHATNFRWPDLTMISIELHVLGAVAWAGGLGAIVATLAANRTLLRHALPRFSRLAGACLVILCVTGLFNGSIELMATPGPASGWHKVWTGLTGTGYGLIMIGKIACFVALAALGANIRWRLLPAIMRHKRTALIGWAALELGVMGIAFGLAVVLSRASIA